MANLDPLIEYQRFRDEIRAEHSLIANRLTWYVTSQSFLVSAFAISCWLLRRFPIREKQMKVVVVGRARSNPGMAGRAKEELSKLASLSRLEEGCINYDIHQALDDNHMFLTHETWESQAAVDLHMKQ